MLKDRAFDPSKIYLSLFQKTKSTAPVTPSGVFIFACFPMATPDLEKGTEGPGPQAPQAPEAPEAPAGAGQIPLPQEEPQKLGKATETATNKAEATTTAATDTKVEATTTGGRCSQSSTLRNTYMCLPTKGGTLLCSMVSSLLVFSGLLAFSFADLGEISNDSRSTPTLSSSLFWRCIGVAVFFYIPILVVATPMERNLVFLVAVLVRRVNVFK